MQIYEATAPEKLKTSAPIDLRFLDLGELRAYLDAKGFSVPIAERLATHGVFGPLFAELVLRNPNLDAERLNDYAHSLGVIEPAPLSRYVGSDEQNRSIDAALANSGIAHGTTRFGQGSATFFSSRHRIPRSLATVPILVIGYGAAGILITYALRQLGFTNITVYEKLRALGIWSVENVYGQSRNNPQRLQFYDHVLEPAPGGGIEVRNFLRNLEVLKPKDATVVKIVPKAFNNAVHLSDGTSERFAIVINAAGLGLPKAVSDPKRMTTLTGAPHAGLRWQQRLDPEKIEGKRLVLIGLGNSTAEMLRQLHALEDQGYDIDYTVLTHYPEQAVRDPTSTIEEDGTMYRMFRDTSRPNLVDFQGDLSLSRYDYFRALHQGRIIAGIRRWEVAKNGTLALYRNGKRPSLHLPFDRIMTLIGYRQPADTMRNMGCSYDDERMCGRFDFDGELIADHEAKTTAARLRKGCYGFGSVLDTPNNPNAIVIPGMIHRIGDVLFGIVMRAAESRKKDFLA